MHNKIKFKITEDTPSSDVYDYIFSGIEFMVSADNPTEVYVEYKNYDGGYDFRSVKDPKFAAYVRTKYRELTGEREAPSFSLTLQKYIDDSIIDENKTEIHTRIGGTSNETVYFLANKANTIVVINKDGYKFRKKYNEYKFIKGQNMIEQVKPKHRGGLLEELDPFLNMDRETKILFIVTIVQEFIYRSSHFLPVICAEQGSGKSTLTRIWRTIVDPAVAVMTTMPESADNLKNHLANNRFICIDNTQPLSVLYSDIICGAITGTSYTKRRLYTDSAEVILNLHNIVILNGIDAIPRKSDLLQRSLLFPLKKITASSRKSENDIMTKFKKSLPYILGAIFNTLSEYYRIKDTVKIKGSHRMADAYADSYIIACVLGVENEFLEAFKNNQEKLQTDYIETNPLISALTDYMDDIGRTQITDTVSNLFNDIKKYSDKQYFPKSPSSFSREVSRQNDALKHAGIAVCLIKKRDYTEMTIRRKK